MYILITAVPGSVLWKVVGGEGFKNSDTTTSVKFHFFLGLVWFFFCLFSKNVCNAKKKNNTQQKTKQKKKKEIKNYFITTFVPFCSSIIYCQIVECSYWPVCTCAFNKFLLYSLLLIFPIFLLCLFFSPFFASDYYFFLFFSFLM